MIPRVALVDSMDEIVGARFDYGRGISRKYVSPLDVLPGLCDAPGVSAADVIRRVDDDAPRRLAEVPLVGAHGLPTVGALLHLVRGRRRIRG